MKGDPKATVSRETLPVWECLCNIADIWEHTDASGRYQVIMLGFSTIKFMKTLLQYARKNNEFPCYICTFKMCL